MTLEDLTSFHNFSVQANNLIADLRQKLAQLEQRAVAAEKKVEELLTEKLNAQQQVPTVNEAGTGDSQQSPKPGA
jgi:hypothetical protein